MTRSLAPVNTTALTPPVVGYVIYIPRVVEGILVPDSFASATINSKGETTMEWVYWPSFPRKILDDAKTLAATLAAPGTRGNFLTLLPAAERTNPGEVAIRHSDFDDDHTFQVFASYDVHAPKGPKHGRAITLNFGVDGKERVHPNRRAGVPTLPTSSSKP